jgi:hypothetical protein
MKKIILILITILISTILTSQVRFNYIIFEDYGREDSTGLIYYTSDPDTVLLNNPGLKSSIVYYFDNERDTKRFIAVKKTKINKEQIVYFGKSLNNTKYKIIYNKKYGDFVIKQKTLFAGDKSTMYFHRDYDYYDQLTGE